MEPVRRPWVLFALAAMTLAIAVVWLAPASLLDSRLAGATGGLLRLADTHGTVWHGRGVVTAAHAQIPVAWDMSFWPLLRGVVHLQIRSDLGTDGPRATIDVGGDAITLQDADVTVPAAAIGSAFGATAANFVDGEVTGRTSNLRLAAGANLGEARLVWRKARLRGIGATPLELGDVTATLVADGATMSGPIANDGGRLALRGDWSVKEKDAFALTMRLTPRNAGDAELSRWLSAVGTQDGDGWRIHWRVPLR